MTATACRVGHHRGLCQPPCSCPGERGQVGRRGVAEARPGLPGSRPPWAQTGRVSPQLLRWWPRSLGLRSPPRKWAHSGSSLREASEVTTAELATPDLAASRGPCGPAEAGASDRPVRPCQPLPPGANAGSRHALVTCSPKLYTEGPGDPPSPPGNYLELKQPGQPGRPPLRCVPEETQNHGTVRGLRRGPGEGTRKPPARYTACSKPRAPRSLVSPKPRTQAFQTGN